MLEPFLGMIQYFGCGYAPYGYANCQGQIVPISTNTALFSLVGTFYGGDGRATFGYPDLQGRSMIGYTNAVPIGEKEGTESATMTALTMPVHTHTGGQLFASSGAGNSTSAVGTWPAADAGSNKTYNSTATSGVTMSALTLGPIGVAGSGLPFSILQPYLALTCCIATQGIFPTRS